MDEYDEFAAEAMVGGTAINRQIGKQVFWSTTARAISAALQLVVIVLLARSVVPTEFAFVSTAYAVLMVMVALNGFGIIRQIEYRRSLDPADPVIQTLFTVRLRYTYVSGLIWVLACVALWIATRDERYLILVPAAIWLVIEQITQVWNGVAIIDGRAQLLIPSYISRRLPVALALGLALLIGYDGLSSWVAGMVVGAFLSYAQGWLGQEQWARGLSPRLFRADGARIQIDIPFWFSELGDQLRDLDVPVVTLVSAATAGIYALPARLVRPMNLVTQAGGMVAFPHIVRKAQVTRKELCTAVAIGCLPVLVAAAVAYFAAPLLPLIVGADYEESIPVLQVLAGTALVSGPSILFCIFLQARTSRALRDSGLIMLLGNFMLLPCVLVGTIIHGAVGAALGALAGQTLVLAVLFTRALVECNVPIAAHPPVRDDSVRQ